MNQILALTRKSIYLSPYYTYLKNVKITEWDIKSAGLSCIKFTKSLPKEEIEKLEKLPKEVRTIKEGLLQKENPKISEAINETLAKVRAAFIVLNNIPIENILAIKKDAIFLINWKPTVTKIKEYFLFREKNTYTSFLKLERYELYYNSLKNVLDVKGVSSESFEKQKNFLFKDISKILSLGERDSSQGVFQFLKQYRKKYLNRELPIETYRELDSNMFRYKDTLLKSLSPDIVEEFDISQNYLSVVLPIICEIL